MAEARIDPIAQIPDADLLEQQALVDPDLIDDERSTVGAERPIDPADEADLVEQSVTLPNGDDEYPHAAGSGWERDA